MDYFHNDYNALCHPLVLQMIQNASDGCYSGYGEDVISQRVAERIRCLCGSNALAVHFLSGGTQTNLTVIAAALRPHQAVLAAESGHIHVHETGAIEATGHKVIPLSSADGKIKASQVEAACITHWSDENHEHMPQPKLLYISQPTEYGTIYTLDELRQLSAVCRQYGLYLFADGARLGYALSASGNDVSLHDLAALTDVFYIGGTKVGAMFGEAVVISHADLQRDFRYIMKQRGAMLAKGWLIGLQFEALLQDNLYFRISQHANLLADKLRKTVLDLGYTMPVANSTNQVFIKLPLDVCEVLKDQFTFCPWTPADEGFQIVRFCTSWATSQESMIRLCNTLQNFT